MKTAPFFKTLIFLMTLAIAVACNTQQKKSSSQEENKTSTDPAGETVFSDPAATLRDAALNGLVDKTKDALKQIENVDAVDEQGHTALMLAAYNGHAEIAGLLLDKGANINLTDSRGLSPLHFAASGPFPETVELLLSKGADINRPDGIEEFTPLMYAAAEGNPEVVKVLLKHNADITLTDKDGDTAAEFARQNNHPEIARLIEEY